MCIAHNFRIKSRVWKFNFLVHTCFSISQVSAPNKKDILQKICEVHIISLNYLLFHLVQEFSNSEYHNTLSERRVTALVSYIKYSTGKLELKLQCAAWKKRA